MTGCFVLCHVPRLFSTPHRVHNERQHEGNERPRAAHWKMQSHDVGTTYGVSNNTWKSTVASRGTRNKGGNNRSDVAIAAPPVELRYSFVNMPFSVSGLDHLLYSGRGAGGHSDEATELHVACFMGLISFLASKQEVLRIAPSRPVRLLDATARAIIQTATPSQTPLTDAGLDGTGEIIQVCLTRAEYVCAIFWRLFPSERVICSPCGQGSLCAPLRTIVHTIQRTLHSFHRAVSGGT